MLAGEIYEPRKIRLIDTEEPELDPSSPGEIIFEPELGCLCGSDLLYFEGDYIEYPPEIGHSLHEMIGRVVDTNGNRFQVGDRILCVPNRQLGLSERFRVSEQQAIPLETKTELPAVDWQALMMLGEGHGAQALVGDIGLQRKV